MAKHILSLTFLFLLCQTGRASAPVAPTPALVAPIIDGNYTDKLAHLEIRALNGGWLPFANKTVCKAAYPFLLDALVATEVNYNTTPPGWGHADSVVLGSDVVLHPMGVANFYGFMSDGVGEHLKSLNIFRIIFSMNSDKSHNTTVMASSPSGNESCVFTNSEWNTSNFDGFNFNLTKLLVPP
ncbi:unnamed protein product [Polarella glacialis]|uniref:Phospholipase B-like n=1 Tax=Polarella glacialis TaxID=89957 RepID=A0A813L0R0_POLGL|nr:unnamed protein product [Polarella glacialis]CAE8634447.1 unnamed protein product [Polarella glacialis]CAE8714214.1 unnamed protein product [Polarella glacialis]CAE8718001.1 unnamed protein product [Polarella glacialis]